MDTFKTFKQYRKEKQALVTETNTEWTNIPSLNEEENFEAKRIYDELSKHNLEDIDEGLLSTILGGATGFVIGPAIGRVIAKALGVEKGILYDMFTSRLVSAALGAAVAKEIGAKFGFSNSGSHHRDEPIQLA